MELVARVKSQLRRAHVFNKPVQDSLHIIEASDLIIDTQKKYVTLDGKALALTRIEYEILVLLASKPGTVFSIEQILESIWHEKAGNSNTIMVHIKIFPNIYIISIVTYKWLLYTKIFACFS